MFVSWILGGIAMREAIFDNKKMEPVPVIASFSVDGEIKPLYVRLQNITLKILSYCIIDQNLAWIEFRCTVEDQGIRKNIKLYYYMHEPSWYWDHG